MRNRNTLWHCADGRTLRVRDMTDRHLTNAIRKFESIAHNDLMQVEIPLGDEEWGVYEEEWSWHGRSAYEWLDILHEEQRRRRCGNDYVRSHPPSAAERLAKAD